VAFSEVLGEALVPIRAQLDKLREDLQNAKQQVERDLGKTFSDVGKTLKDAGQKISTYVTLPILGTGAAILRTAGDFEASMNRVRALTGATGQEFEALRNQAKELGRTTQFSASQAADAMGFLAMAGFDVNQILGAMPSTLQLAAAAQIDLATAADITSNILTGYGLAVEDLQRANDVLVATFTKANVNLRMLGESFKYVGPIASQVGVPLEETAAAIGLLGDAGIQGSMAGTALRGAISRLLNPTKQTQKILERLGITVRDSAGNFVGFESIIRQLQESGATTADIMQIFGDRAGPAMAALVARGADALAQLRQELEQSGGTAQRIAEIQMEGFNGALLEMQSALEGVMLAIAESGLLEWATALVQQLTGLIQRIAEADPALLRIGTVFALVAAAIGPLLIALGALTAAVGSLITTGPMLVAKFGMVVAAAGPVLAVITALAAAALLLWANWDTVGPKLAALWEQVKARVQPALDSMRQAIGDVVAYVQERWPQIQQTLQTFLDWVEPVFRFVWEGVKSTVLFYVDTIAGIIQGFVDVVTGIIKFFAAILSGDWQAAWEAVKQIVSGAVQALWNLFKLWLWGKIASLIGGWLGDILKRIRSWAGKMLEPVVSFLSRMGQSVSSGLARVVGFFRGALENVQGVVRSALDRVVGFFQGFVDDALRPIISMGSRLYDIGRNLVESLWRGIQSLAGWLKDKLLGFAKNIIPGPIARVLGISSPSKLMMGFGEEIARGLALGMERNAQQVAQAARSLTTQIAQPAMPAIWPAAVPAPATPWPERSAWPGPAGRPLEVVLQLDGREMARQQLPYLVVELAQANRMARLAIGR